LSQKPKKISRQGVTIVYLYASSFGTFALQNQVHGRFNTNWFILETKNVTYHNIIARNPGVKSIDGTWGIIATQHVIAFPVVPCIV
jgi:hypothetical protein